MRVKLRTCWGAERVVCNTPWVLVNNRKLVLQRHSLFYYHFRRGQYKSVAEGGV